MRIVYLVLASMLVGFVSTAHAQGSFDDFLAQDKERQENEGTADEELRKFEQVLNGEDTDRALAAMKFMMASDKPRLARYAREFGLLSAEALFRQEALISTFDSIGSYRIEIDLTEDADQKDGVNNFLRSSGTFSADGKTGFYTFMIEPFDAEKGCWKFKGYNTCAFILTNSSVSLTQWGNADGALTLDDNGALVGSFRTAWTTKSVPAKIILLE